MSFVLPIFAALGEAVGVGGTAAAGTAAASTAATAATAGGLFGTGISGWSALGLLGSAVSAFGSYSMGQAQADAAKLQATNAVIEGNQRSLEYQKQGLSVMNRMLETNATINARAAAGGIDPFSGSAGNLSDYAFAKGVDELNWAKENATSAVLAGQSNAAALRTAASNYSAAGTIGAFGSLAMAGARFGSTGGFSLLDPVKSTSSMSSIVQPTAFGFGRNV